VSDDRLLIESALQGDRSAFTALVERYQDRLFNSMLHVTGSAEEAEDVVQDAFIRAFLRLDSFQQNSQFFTWLYRIAFNTALTRRRRKRPNISLDHYREVSGQEASDEGASVDEGILQNERVELVRAAIASLSENHRAILVLREMQDRSYEDISEILEISIGTVRSRLNRARMQLKLAIESLSPTQQD
jgi:RNA polymerase sigma-70 factor, ECF subfamily